MEFFGTVITLTLGDIFSIIFLAGLVLYMLSLFVWGYIKDIFGDRKS